MNQIPLILENLGRLNFGQIDKIFQQQLRSCVKDCEERPGDKGPRTVSIIFTLTPDPDMHGNELVCDGVDVACDVQSKVPKTKTRVFSMKPKQNGMLFFNPDVPEDPEAEGLYDPQTGEEKSR
jgi:hypothetical protein